MVFGCTQLGCGKAAGAWRAVRCQLSPAQCTAIEPCLPLQQLYRNSEEVTDQSAEVPAADSTEQLAGQLLAASPGAQRSQTSKDDWGFDHLGDWGSGGEAAPAAGSAAAFSTGTEDAFDFTELTSSLEAAGRQQHQAATATAAAAAAATTAGTA